MVLEGDGVHQLVARREQVRDFAIRILLPQRFLECPDQIPEADRILLSLRQLPMSRLVQGKTGTFVRLENLLWVVVAKDVHVFSYLRALGGDCSPYLAAARGFKRCRAGLYQRENAIGKDPLERRD